MRFKLDENLPREFADDLVRLGHEADTVHAEGLVGADDALVVQAALESGRILMTLDKGIASLLRNPIRQHGGICYFDQTHRADDRSNLLFGRASKR